MPELWGILVYKVLHGGSARQKACNWQPGRALYPVQSLHHTSSPMHAAPAPSQDIRRIDLTLPESLGLHAIRLLERIGEAGSGGLIYVAEGERRAEQLAEALRGLAPDLEIYLLPPWDCLPYDSAPPSREAMGRRMSVLRRMTEPSEAPRRPLA